MDAHKERATVFPFERSRLRCPPARHSISSVRMATTALGCSPAHQAAKLAGELAAHSAALDWLQALGLPVPAASDPTELWRDCQLL